MLRRAICLLLLVAACSKASSSTPPPAAAKSTCQGDGEVTGSIHWFEDDLAKAQACAAERKVPLVIDEWAPWCHTCLSMKTTVFTDPAFAAVADRFVWLAVDTDKDENAPVVDRYTPAAWPTYWVIDGDGNVGSKFVGSTSVSQFREFLSTGEKAYLAGAKLDPASPEAHLVAAEKAMADANHAPKGPARAAKLGDAVKEYQAAIAAAPADWPRRADVLVDTVGVMERYADPKTCIDFANQYVDQTGNAASACDFVVSAQGCVDELAKTDPAAAQAFRQKAATRIEGVLANPAAALSIDDRGDAMANLRDLYDQLGRHDDAVAIAEKARAMLDDAAAKAPDPLAAMTYNWPRSEVYMYLKKDDELIPALEKSAADLPNQYDPPYRLAGLYKDEGKLDEALVWAKKSLALAYGPRKARVQSVIADIVRAKGDTAAELQARKDLVAIYQGLPAGQANPDALEKAQADVAAIEAMSSSATPPK